MTKPIWTSKTFWVNTLSMLAGVFSMFGMDFLNIEMQGELIVVIMGVANIALRWVTKGPVSLSGDDG